MNTKGVVAAMALALLLAAQLFLVAGCSAPAPKAATLNGLSMVARTSGRYFQVYSGGAWTGHLVKGVNIGASMPGHWFGELSITEDMYKRWFDEIGRMNANTLLVYTLLNPDFYQALDSYNRAHPDRRLWLIQQVWPLDQAVTSDLYNPVLVNTYRREMGLDVAALMGKINIKERAGLAWGKYTANVLPYLLGMVIGREITNLEVRNTSLNHPDKSIFSGDIVQAAGGSNATEVWCADMAQTLGSLLRDRGWAVPLGYVSWPTLDPIVHTTEATPDRPKSKEVDDSEVLDPRHLGPGPKSTAGFFGMFQVYPYYPEFMYRQPSYADYRDSQGVLRYGGYLKDFMTVMGSYPALVGEFGLPTSVSCAHQQPEGLSQGGIDERTQGAELSRMYRAIVREGYAGGLVFEWADEWAKKNWTTAPYMIPFDRHILWHNATDPEQNFGLLAFDSREPTSRDMKLLWMKSHPSGSPGEVQAVYGAANADFMYLALNVKNAADLLQSGQEGMTLSVGISTLGEGHGTTSLPVADLPQLTQGVEFLLQLGGEQSLLLCRPDYNRGTSRLWAAPASDPTFEHTTYITNREQVDTSNGHIFPAIYTDQSVLRYGVFNTRDPRYTSLGNWYVEPGASRVMVRIPWGLLNVSDVSSNRAILDQSRDLPQGPSGLLNTGPDSLNTARTPGLSFFAASSRGGILVDYAPRSRSGQSFGDAIGPIDWRGWEQPKFTERLKASYAYIRSLYGGFNAAVVPPPPQ